MEIRKVETEFKEKLKLKNLKKGGGTDCLWQVVTAVSAVLMLGFNHLGLEILSEQPGLNL